MFKSFLIFELFVCAVAHAAPVFDLRVLMIGNSLTYTYNIPGIIERMAAVNGKKIEITLHVAGGKSLMWHWNNRTGKPPVTAQEKIADKKWDIVILQDSSQATKDTESIGEFRHATKDYLNLTRKNSNARIILYMPFIRRANVTELEAKGVIDVYTKQANSLGIECAPVALSFVRMREMKPEFALLDNQIGLKYAFNKHSSHQSPFGSYLAASTIYAAIYNETPVGNKYRLSSDSIVIDDEDALLAQQVAWDSWSLYSDCQKMVVIKKE